MPVPKLRFKDENGKEYSEWEKCKLSNYLVVNPDRNTKLCFTKNDVYSVSGELGVVNQISLLGRSFAGASVAPYHVVYTNDVIYTKSPLKAAPYGIIKTNRGKAGIVSTLYAVYHPKKNTNPQFVEYYFGNDHRQNKYLKPLVNIGSKHDMKISNDAVLDGMVCFPSLPEQEKIADFLSSYDHMIDVQSQRVEAMKTRKKGLLQKIFSQEIRFKDDQGQDYPEWEYHKINEFAKCVAGATPSTKYVEYWNHGTIPWMSSGEVNRRIIRFTDKKISKIGYDNSSTKLLPANTVVMALAGQGKTRGMVALTKIELCTNQSLCAIVVDSTIKSEYLYQYLLTRYDNLRLISSGDGTRGGLNLKLVGNYTVPVPSLQEQQKIADFLTAIDAQIEVEEKRLETMKTIKKGLLQQMFI